MGIYDREYYRRDGPSFLGSLAEQGRVTTWLIGITIVCFMVQMATRSAVYDELGRRISGLYLQPFTDALLLDVPLVLQGQVWRLVTYAFLHDTGSIWHILFNMLVLFWFGRQVEEAIGSREFLAFYLLGAVVSGLGFMAANLSGVQPATRCLGASGAVTAALVVAACIYPRQIIYLFFVVPVPIWAFVVLTVAVDAFQLLGQSHTGVAVSAHLAGAAFGFCYFRFRWRLTDWIGGVSGWAQERARPRLRVYREEEEEETPTPRPVAPRPERVATAAAPRVLEDEQLEAQMDAILEKIQRVGMHGLTEKERQTLVRASEAIKRRRS
jgi:membrane associated rhomboid family serine protease